MGIYVISSLTQFSVAYTLSDRKTQDSAPVYKLCLYMLGLLLFEAGAAILVSIMLNFCVYADVGNAERLIFRSSLIYISFCGTIEICLSLTKFLTQQCNVERYPSYVLSFVVLGTVGFTSRVIQSGSESATMTALYEVGGIISQLLTVDSLLRGETPLQWLLSFINYGTKKVAQIKPAEAGNASGKLSKEEEEQVEKSKFCTSIAIVIAVTELSGILASSYPFLTSNMNPTEPGGEKLAKTTVLTNLAIMLCGECFITNTIIALATHFGKRWTNSIAEEWHHTRKSGGRRFFIALLLMTSITQIYMIVQINVRYCFTGWDEGDEDWVMTACPPFPRNVTDMMWYDKSYYTAEYLKENPDPNSRRGGG
ncbi:hypothetical protein TrCOL_g7879 [Triparma columacea]|uniref:Uncharacterized protein n=1 Tax=Triparma columacea TaxID=722753 RepID=A0A9W7G993_9STRA|nr:hypothetical protein TrCOL_g7879 [Triparma columacea]